MSTDSSKRVKNIICRQFPWGASNADGRQMPNLSLSFVQGHRNLVFIAISLRNLISAAASGSSSSGLLNSGEITEKCLLFGVSIAEELTYVLKGGA
ncbi:hypothetical protein CEXT_38441 [Caerostris extrusa]|uniref:Uncharacterized protein n=1 Tax=Caerostris extrusa TaxID=172846 RepID=A0AAV4TU15_CAEEX|nr:hypothetical protein CEXT_38441 [Caerostris extrusa]